MPNGASTRRCSTRRSGQAVPGRQTGRTPRLGEIATWDRSLAARARACWCRSTCRRSTSRPGSAEPMVRLPLLLAGPDGDRARRRRCPTCSSEGTPRPAGVHLHWAMPDALLRGSPRPSGRRHGQPARPARRCPTGGSCCASLLPDGRSDAARARLGARGRPRRRHAARRVVARARGVDRPRSRPASPSTPASSPGTVGGSVSVGGVVRRRRSTGSPSTIRSTTSPRSRRRASTATPPPTSSPAGGSDPARDPLDGARSADSLAELLDALRWRLLATGATPARAQLRRAQRRRAAQGARPRRPATASTERRASTHRRSAPRAAAAGCGSAFSPIDDADRQADAGRRRSTFVGRRGDRYVDRRRGTCARRCCTAPCTACRWRRRRPSTSARTAAALARRPRPARRRRARRARLGARRPCDQPRRDTERLLAAFTAQKLNRIGTPDGLAEIEEHEHAAAFASLPGGIARHRPFLQRAATGGAGGRRRGKPRRRPSTRRAAS